MIARFGPMAVAGPVRALPRSALVILLALETGHGRARGLCAIAVLLPAYPPGDVLCRRRTSLYIDTAARN